MSIQLSSFLKELKILSECVKEERSSDLKPVSEPYLGIVPSWRNPKTNREHKLHHMMSRVGGFPPSLARYFIAAYSKPGEIVLDPFCGKGTTLLESVIMGRIAVGGDIADDVVIVSKAKCNPVSIASLANYLENLKIYSDISFKDIHDDVRIFYSKKTLTQILSLRSQLLDHIQTNKKKKQAIFVCGILLGILHGHSKFSLSLRCNQAFAMSPNYVRKYVAAHGLKCPDRNVKDCILMKSLELLPAPHNMEKSYIYKVQAQKCDSYVKRSVGNVDLIITSPPYLNRQTYIRDSWLRTWFLNGNATDLKATTLETGNISRFIDGMKSVLSAIEKCIKPNGRIVLVCGRAIMKEQHTSLRIADLCLYVINNMKTNLRIEKLIIDRKLMTRGSYFAVHHGKANGGNPGHRYGEEEILILRK